MTLSCGVCCLQIEMDDVGSPKMLCVGHDAKGTRTDWFVDKVGAISDHTRSFISALLDVFALTDCGVCILLPLSG